MRSSDCRGSFVPLEPKLVGMKATCPLCGAKITVGYGGRIPVHPDQGEIIATDTFVRVRQLPHP